MKKLYTIILALALVSCVKEAANDIFEGKPFALVTAEDGAGLTLSADIDDDLRTISFTLSESEDLSSVPVLFQLNPDYSLIEPSVNEQIMNLSAPVDITVEGYGKRLVYALDAVIEAPVRAASVIFKGERIDASINTGRRTLTFPMGTIYSSEYPEILFAGLKPEIELEAGYTLTEMKDEWDIAGGDTFSVTDGEKILTYTVTSEISTVQAKSHLNEFDIHRGVNLAYWMVVGDAERDWLGYIKPEIFPLWKELGFDHFRIPVKEDIIFNADGSFHDLAIGKLHEILDWCEANDFHAILDLHEISPREGTTSYREQDLYDPAYPEFRAKFVRIWARLAEEFREYSPAILAFELLNEHHDYTDDSSAWEKLQNEVLSAIRAVSPERVTLVPSMGWQDPKYIRHSKIKAGDPNVIISFHDYLPMLLTHYKLLAWKDYQGSIQYPGRVIPNKADADAYPRFSSFYQTTYSAQRIMSEMGAAATDGANLGRMVHCGEFGCSKNVPESMRLEWFKDMIAAMDANNIPWTLWESLGGGFGFVDEDGKGGNRINVSLLGILTGKELTVEEADAVLKKYGLRTY